MNLIKKFKNIQNIKLLDKDKKMLFNILIFLVILWATLYAIPELFISIFYTILGNLILLLLVVLISIYNYKYGIMISIIFLIIYRFNYLSKISTKEGFTWTQDSIDNFIQIQNSTNRNIVFDVNQIQKQASQEEVNYFIQNGMWPWSEEVQTLYTEAVLKNPFIRTYPKDAINTLRTIYNQSAILEIISWQTKEGQFLQRGVQIYDGSANPKEDLPSGWGNYGYNSGLIHPMKDVIKCGTDSHGNMSLQKITYTGKGGIFNQQTKQITPVDYNDLENLIPGFKFTNGSCNPCGALNSPPDYSCGFKLDLKNTKNTKNTKQKMGGLNVDVDTISSNDNNSQMSNVWKYLWGK